MVLLAPTMARADAERLTVVVRLGARDATIVTRLRGQLADLEGVTLELEPGAGAIEPALDNQLAAAERLGAAHGARVVVWFIPRGKKLVVAIATPRDHRLFVREIPAAAESTMAEAAAIAVRSAVRSIALGGTIGVEVKPAPAGPPATVEPAAEPAVAPSAPRASSTTLAASLGWQAAFDGGADRGAHAVAQRTTLARGAWAASLTLSLGAPLDWRASSDVVLDVSRSGALVGGERRIGGGLALGLGAGALVYHRSTQTAPSGLASTPSNSTVAFTGALEVTWRARIAGSVGILASAGVDLVAGAPEAAIARAAMVEVVDTIRPVQPRASLALEVGAW